MFFHHEPLHGDFDRQLPLFSTLGRGPRGDSVSIDVIDDKKSDTYRIVFRNSRTGEVMATTPNISSGTHVFACDKSLEVTSDHGTYTVDITDFAAEQAGTATVARVGDIVLFQGYRADDDDPDTYHDMIGAGAILSVGKNGAVTFVSHVESDTGIVTAMIADKSVTKEKLSDDLSEYIEASTLVFNSNPSMSIEGFLQVPGYACASMVMYGDGMVLAIFESIDTPGDDDGLYKIISVGGALNNRVLETGTLDNVGHANSACVVDGYLYVMKNGLRVNVYSIASSFQLVRTITLDISDVGQIVHDDKTDTWYCCQNTHLVGDTFKNLDLYELDIDTGECTLVKRNIIPNAISKVPMLRNDCFMYNGMIFVSVSYNGYCSHNTITVYDVANDRYGGISTEQRVNGYFEVVEPEGMCFDETTKTVYLISKNKWYTGIIVSFNLYSNMLDNVNLGYVPNGAGELRNVRVSSYDEQSTIYMSGNTDAPFSSLGCAIEFALSLVGGTTVVMLDDIEGDFQLIPPGDVNIALNGHTLSFSNNRMETTIGTLYISGDPTNRGTFSGEIYQSRGCTVRLHKVDFTEGSRVSCGSNMTIITDCGNCTINRIGLQSCIITDQ